MARLHTHSTKIAPKNSSTKASVMLIVLDGWGYREDSNNNAVAAAKKLFFDSIWQNNPHSLLEASGLAVGLPVGQMGNSEVGHTTIGAGAILDTDLVRIDKAARAGEFSKNPTMFALFDHVKKHNSTLHVMGLVSDGGVHSHLEHLHIFLRTAKQAGVPRVAIHAFTDGRDTAPQSAAAFMKKLETEIAQLDPSGVKIFIASLSGRYFAMDRDNNWDRMKKAATAIFESHAAHAPSAVNANFTPFKPSVHLEKVYAEGKNDELLEPVAIKGAHGTGAPLANHDGIFVFNFRADRVRMIAQKLADLKKEAAAKGAGDIHIATMTEYSKEHNFPVAFGPKTIETTLGEQVSVASLTQAHIAETEKFPHATYFLNGGRNEPYPGEEHIMLASRKDVKTHDEAPEMRAEAIADKTIEQIKAGTHFIFVNFANPDMVGHTANVPAIITAIETVDRELKRIIDALERVGGAAIIIADHGNAEVNVDPETGLPHTAHTINAVPCILAGDLKDRKFGLKNGGLADVAPTILELLDLKKPQPMTGNSLLTK